MHKKRLLSVIVCIGLIWLISQLGLFNALNGFFYSRFQSESINKHTQFATITIEQNAQSIPTYSDWNLVLDKVLNWTNSDVYLIDFFAQGDSNQLLTAGQNERVHFIQTSYLDEDQSVKSRKLPEDFNSKNIYSLSFPNFTNGAISNYLVDESLNVDVIQDIYHKRQQKFSQPFNINFMIGQSYLPSVNFADVIDNKVDERLFSEKSVIIVNQSSRIVPTILSHSRKLTQGQYYAYLFETAIQDLELKNLSSAALILVLSLIAIFVLLLSYFLPNRFRLSIVLLSSFILLLLSFLLLGSGRVYLPVIETILAIVLPMFLIQGQDYIHDKEQLLLGTRAYRQILETSGKSQGLQSNSALLESFSQFFCTLTGIEDIQYEMHGKGQNFNLSYKGSKLEEQQNINVEHEFEYKLPLFNSLKATIRIDTIPKHSDVQTIQSVLITKEQYLKILLTQLAEERIERSRGFLRSLISNTRFTAEHENFRITTENFLSHYHLLRNNFESLNTASVLYGVNGKIIQTNHAAEQFIRENDIRLFNQTLIESLLEITELEQVLIREALLDLVEDQDLIIVWPTRKNDLDKSYLVSVSAYNSEKVTFGGFLIELLDIEEVDFVSSLKNNFISELNNQLRNDFSEVMLSIDFLAMGIEGGLSLAEVNAKVLEFSEKLQSSDMMLQSTNDIMRNKQYPVDIRKLVAQSVKATSDAIEEKQITLNIKQPRFINLVLVHYQHFAQICKQLMLFAVQDCMDEGELSLIINELERNSERFVSIVIKTKGYGIFDQAKVGGNSYQDISQIPELAKIEKYILSLGGEIKLESSVGEGSEISTLLPCYRF